MATWDAYEMDPCYGGCGGSDSIEIKFKNKISGEVISIDGICNGWHCARTGEFPKSCMFQNDEELKKYLLVAEHKEEWEILDF